MTTLIRSLLLCCPLLTLQAGVYEDLEYGDSKLDVTKKLMNCERVENTVPETMFGRVGLNGTFRIKKQLNGLSFALYFDWDEDDQLKEITLRSDAIPVGEYNSTLKEAFKSASSLITELYGNPVMGNTMPTSSQLEEGMILNSHLWHPEEGTLLMGVARENGKYHLSIRFLEKRIEPVRN
ncbi:hypothetical protein [Rubritalea tangerina]|uniref:Uncharacterized protein n=1 Tax=Rubritalea tangerina TaxID=430798 RepID=A0ABW4ZC17_9BACT